MRYDLEIGDPSHCYIAGGFLVHNSGLPIVHTERVGSPKTLEPVKDTVLRGELYATQNGKAIPAAQLSGLLNSSIELALLKQKERDIRYKHAVFDILQHEGHDVRALPYAERLKLLKGVLAKMPEDFHLPEGYTDPAKQRELWDRIRTGKDPLTHEGVVAHPLTAVDAVPIKAKTGLPERDVLIKGIVPGEGKYRGTHAGGFWYALPEEPDKIVGKVGQGISDGDRQDMWQNKGEWLGRTARVHAQDQFPSGAYRVPVFLGRHEDITQKAAAFLEGYKQALEMAPAVGRDRVARLTAPIAAYAPKGTPQGSVYAMALAKLQNTRADKRLAAATAAAPRPVPATANQWVTKPPESQLALAQPKQITACAIGKAAQVHAGLRQQGRGARRVHGELQ